MSFQKTSWCINGSKLGSNISSIATIKETGDLDIYEMNKRYSNSGDAVTIFFNRKIIKQNVAFNYLSYVPDHLKFA